MPSSDQSKTQPGVDQQTPSEAGGAADLQDALHQIASQITEADQRHCDALNDMLERLGQFDRQVEQVRPAVSKQHAGSLDRLEQEIAALAGRMAAVGQVRQSHKSAGEMSRAQASAETNEPWDSEQAEALTRVYEMAEAEFAATRKHPRTPAPKKQVRGKRGAATGQPAQGAESDRVWLEDRFAAIATLLQQSLAVNNPTESFTCLAQRLDHMEARLDGLRNDLSARFGGDWLKLIEQQVKELAAHFEATNRQLTRLDAIDEQLHQLSRALDEHRQWSQAQPANLRDDAIESLIETAVERASSRLPSSAPAPEADGGTRIGALEGMMQDYIAERRRSEEATSGILRTVEEALIRITDRIDAMEDPALYPRDDINASEADGMEMESKRLAEAYASGALVLGQQGTEPTLHAADYVPSVSRPEEATGAEAGADIKQTVSVEGTETRQELRASAMRGKLKAQAAPEEPLPLALEPDDARTDAAAQARAKIPAKAGGVRSRWLMGGSMLLLFVAGYVGVDVFLMGDPTEVTRSIAPKPSNPPAAGLVQPEPLAGKPDLAPPAADGKIPVPQPAKRRTAEPAAGDMPPSQAQEGAIRYLTGGLQVPQGAPAADPISEPAAISPQAVPGVTLQGGQLTGNDSAAPSGPDAMLPDSVGTAALRDAAVSGDAFAQFEVGTRFAEGHGVAKDYKLAFAWYERAATRGLAAAQFRLGAFYERGVGVVEDPERAKVWYRRAADQGHVKAMHNLAVLIVGKDQEHSDYATAVHWFQEAAMRGYVDSQFNLATLYAHGRGVDKDLTESYKWFALAARAGDDGAARRLEDIKGQLEPSQLKAAEQKVAAWHPQGVEPASR